MEELEREVPEVESRDVPEFADVDVPALTLAEEEEPRFEGLASEIAEASVRGE